MKPNCSVGVAHVQEISDLLGRTEISHAVCMGQWIRRISAQAMRPGRKALNWAHPVAVGSM